jgi:hypothetical protein
VRSLCPRVPLECRLYDIAPCSIALSAPCGPESARPLPPSLPLANAGNQEFYVNVPEGGTPGQKFNLQLPDGVRKARMKKFYPPKRRSKKKSGGRGEKDSGGGGDKDSGSRRSRPKGPAAPIVSIDFGSETIKIAVETDFPDPMVLNMQGGRTTPNVLALQDDEIFFGDIAVSLQQRVNTSYVHTKQLLGRRVDESGPKDTDPSGGPPWFHAMGLHYDFVPDPRGTVRLPDGKRCDTALRSSFQTSAHQGALRVAHDSVPACLSSQR